MTRLCGAVPRALADDLMVEAAGGAQEPAFGHAVTATLDLLDEACCFVSVEKCVIVDSTAAGRKAKR
eukprot:15284792-Alexandrium_andersonii.AAC.1